MKIGLLDSGIGGLSVLHEALNQLPENHYVYYADVDHVPYGEKTVAEIKEYVDQSIEFLVNDGCEIIVIACNTATSAAVSDMRKKYSLPIIGMEPAVKKAVELDPEHKILVAATTATIKGNKLKSLIEEYDLQKHVTTLALPDLVNLAEQLNFREKMVIPYLEKALPANAQSYSTLVLGCTHFNYYKNFLKQLLPNTQLIDGNEGTVNHLKDYITHNDPQQIDFYFSGRKAELLEVEKMKIYLKRLDEMKNI